MFDFLFLILSLPFLVLLWRGVETLMFCLARKKQDAPRYVTLIYEVLAVEGGIVLALSQVGTVGIAFMQIEPFSPGDLFFISLIGYLIYNLFTPSPGGIVRSFCITRSLAARCLSRSCGVIPALFSRYGFWSN